MQDRNLLAMDNVTTVPFNGTQPLPVRQGISSTVREIASTQITFCGFLVHNNDATLVTWVQIFFKPRAEVTLGTTSPDLTIKIGAGQSLAWDFLNPVRTGNGLSVASTTTETGSTGPSAATTGAFFVKLKSGQTV